MEALPFPPSRIPAANVASVPQRSPLRYPGGKTWLIPHLREWLGAAGSVLVEPFAGGGIVSLTAVMEGRADSAVLVERDREVAAFWRAVLEQPEELIARVKGFSPDRDAIRELLRTPVSDPLEHGFRTLVLNRTRRGGVLAPGASLTKHGENGKGLASRWYPETLAKRIRAIAEHADRLCFLEGDGERLLAALSGNSFCRFFVDPPYTAGGGKSAGSRLYAHNSVNHARIFETLANGRCDFLLTCDCSVEIATLVRRHAFHAVTVEMKNGHHARIPELVITRQDRFS